MLEASFRVHRSSHSHARPTAKAGKVGQKPPVDGALWRGYFDCAKRILTLYAGQVGRGGVLEKLQAEGWAFRNRWNQPRAISGDDVRRVVSNWREYAGLIGDGRAKERIANAIENPTGVLYDTGRAVFDLDLLAAVARTQEARSVTTRPTGSVTQPHVFPLSFLLYCAACDHEATEQGNPKLRARITGHNKNGLLRYRHADGRRCRSTRKCFRNYHC